MSRCFGAAAAAFAVILSACGGAEEVDAPGDPTPAAEEIDPWALIIESGRWGVLINRAREGALLQSGADLARDQSDVELIDTSLRIAALDMLRLRDVICSEGVAPPADPACAPIPMPGWVLAPPDYEVSLAELQRRSDWVGETSSGLVGIGCQAGDASIGASLEDGPPSFCMVE